MYIFLIQSALFVVRKYENSYLILVGKGLFEAQTFHFFMNFYACTSWFYQNQFLFASLSLFFQSFYNV